MRGTVFTLMWIACSVACAGTVYKWVDDNGVTHYSDQPHENAAKVDLQQPQAYKAPPVPNPGQVAAPQPTSTEKAYASCGFIQPTPEQVFFNTFDVTVSIQALPVLRGGDRITVTLDGKPVPGASGPQVTLTQLDRGAHSVQATIQDGAGKTLCQTPGVSFYIRQPSQQAPNGANRPKG